jgi:predicted transposase YbfD/YdcC
MESSTTLFTYEVGSLFYYLQQMRDTRKRRGVRYQLSIILLLIVLAKLCGEDSPFGIADWVKNRSEWLCQALSLSYSRFPHHSTYRRIMEAYEEELDRVITVFLAQLAEKKPYEIVVIDGKTLRGTITADDAFGVHLLTAFLPEVGIALKHLPVEKEKENEIVVAPKLLAGLDLQGKIVLGDAMQTHRALSSQVVEANGHFVWIVKDNQKLTRQAIELLFTPEIPKPGQGCPPLDFQTAKSFDANHGRAENRAITVSSMLNDYVDWPYVQQVFKLDRQFVDLSTGKVHQETQYGITSLQTEDANPGKMLTLVRSEWGIENQLHFRRDVTFHEDKTRMTRKPMARSMAVINNLVIALLNKHGSTNHAQSRRLFCAKPSLALTLVCRL